MPISQPTSTQRPSHPLRSEQFTTTEEIVELLSHQPTNCSPDPDTSEYHCQSGNKGFRIYRTPFPRVAYEDIQPGVLVYRPLYDPYSVIEIDSTPYRKRRPKVDVIKHTRSHTGSNPTIKRTKSTLFVSHIRDCMTYMTPETHQVNILEYQS